MFLWINVVLFFVKVILFGWLLIFNIVIWNGCMWNNLLVLVMWIKIFLLGFNLKFSLLLICNSVVYFVFMFGMLVMLWYVICEFVVNFLLVLLFKENVKFCILLWFRVWSVFIVLFIGVFLFIFGVLLGKDCCFNVDVIVVFMGVLLMFFIMIVNVFVICKK